MDLTTSYKIAKATLKQDIAQLRFSKNEKIQIEKVLNTFYNPKNSGQINSETLTPEEYSEVIKYIEEVANLGVNEATLRVTPEETWLRQQKVDPTIKPLKLKTQLRGKHKGKFTIQKNQLDKIIMKIQELVNGGNASASYIKRAEQALKELEEAEEIVWANGGKSKVVSQNLVMRLNHLYSQVNSETLQTAIGDIGEYFAGAVLAAANAKSAQGIEKITSTFLKSLPPQMMEKVGTDKSFHYQASYSTENNGIKQNVIATQDKVDVIVEFNGRLLNLSVKNYQNISNITIFKGNLLTLLGSHKHYSDLLRSYIINRQEDEPTYHLLKKISFIKALSGGQLALNAQGDVIKTGVADYLIVNHQGKRFYAWSTSEIARKVGKDVNIAKFSPEFPHATTSNLISGNDYVQSAFSTHISLLTKTLK